MKLKWQRDPHSGHWAYGDVLGYQLQREGQGWLLRVREVKVTAGVQHVVGSDELLFFRRRFDTLAEAKDIVQRFEDDPTNDMHHAVQGYHREVTEPRIAAIIAEYDRRH